MGTVGQKITPDSIISFGSQLFKDNDYDWSAMGCDYHLLPFTDAEILWKTPDFRKSTDPLRSARNFGIRAAAAWVITVGHRGTGLDPSLAQIISSREFQNAINDRSDSGQGYAAQEFLRQIMRLLWTLGQMVSPTQIADDAEATIRKLDFCEDPNR
jgi:hypothetical protein